MDPKSFLRLLGRYGVAVFLSWALIGVLLGSGTVLMALVLVMMTSFGTALMIQGYYDIRPLIRRKKYVGILVSLIFYGFGLMIALVTLYTIVVDGIFRK